MSVAVLTDVYDEMRRLAIAGSNLAGGDFRMKKLIPPLQKAGQKAPVFGKVADGIQKLVDSPPQASAEALLELSTLVSAILYTQGETGAEGKLEPIETTEFGLLPSTTSARMLKPLIEALTTSGSGRQEIIVDAHRRGAFQDLRLIGPALAAIDDDYAEIADFVADNVLPAYGKALYDDLKSSYDPKGKGGAVRRLRLMHRLDAETTRPMVEEALQSASPEVKIAAIECLEGCKDALPHLLGLVKAKAVRIRQAALRSIAKFGDDAVADALIQALSGEDLELASQPASRNPSPKLLKFLHEEAEKQFAALLTNKDKAAAKTLPARFYSLLGCFASRRDKETLALLTRLFERREEIGKLKGDRSGQEINRRLAMLLVQSGAKPSQKLVVDSHETLAAEVLDVALLAAVRSRSPKEVHDLFSPYYLAKTDPKKKGRDPAGLKREAVRGVLRRIAANSKRFRGSIFGEAYFDYDVDLDGLREPDKPAEDKDIDLDPRWLEAAVRTKDLELVHALAVPKNAAACNFLSAALDGLLSKKGELDFDVSNILETMIRIEHPKTTEHYVEALKKASQTKRSYYTYWIARLIPDLPPAAAAPLESLLATMPEAMIDQIVPYLTELKTKTTTSAASE